MALMMNTAFRSFENEEKTEKKRDALKNVNKNKLIETKSIYFREPIKTSLQSFSANQVSIWNIVPTIIRQKKQGGRKSTKKRFEKMQNRKISAWMKWKIHNLSSWIQKICIKFACNLFNCKRIFGSHSTPKLRICMIGHFQKSLEWW